MISERCSASTYPEDVAETAASDAVPDRMVKIEMEAAEALANLSRPVERGNSGHLIGKMAGKAKRGRRQVKCESPSSTAASYPADSAPSCSDLAQDPVLLLQQQDERSLLAKAEQDDQLLSQSHICNSDNLSFGGGRSNHNLSEAEKEAKRLRRVLANRESARRTICRRQALCVELARKAAELSKENEKLKKGKESALREYERLKSRNKNLKAKVEKVANLEREKTPIIKKAAKAAIRDIVEHINVIKPSQTEMPTTLPANLPVLLHNASFTPFMWPALFQSSTSNLSIMHGSHTLQAYCNPDHSNEHSTANISPPVYIRPFPLFLGLPDPVHPSQTSCFDETEIGVEMVELNNQQHHMMCPSSRTITPDGKPVPDVIRPSKACGLSVEVMFANDLNEIPMGSPPLDEAAQSSEALHEEAMVYRMTDAGSDLHLSLSGKEDVFPSTANDVIVSYQENNHQGPFLTLSGKKKLVDVTAAAEARRRRKELKKLKAVHGSRCRLRC